MVKSPNLITPSLITSLIEHVFNDCHHFALNAHCNVSKKCTFELCTSFMIMFFKMGQTRPLFGLFSLFFTTQGQI